MCRFLWPQLANPLNAEICLTSAALFRPHLGEVARYGLHILWPLGPGFVRAFITSTILLVQGYTFEYQLGTVQFGGIFLVIHMLSATLLLWGFTGCFVSNEATLAGLAVAMHRCNPKVHTDGVDKGIRVHFAIEPRWHIWALLAVLLLHAENFEQTLVYTSVGLLVGTLVTLRERQAWTEVRRGVCRRSAHVGRCIHVVLLVASLFFLPLTMLESPREVLARAVADGEFRWWQSVTASPPLLHMALGGGLSDEAVFICKLLLALALPLLLSPFVLWTRIYAAACALLLMYSMNSDVFFYPHVGFLSLIYLVFALWRLPHAVAWERRIA